MRRSFACAALAAALAIGLSTTGLGHAADADPWTGTSRPWPASTERRAEPEDRYALAGGCYRVTASDGYVGRGGDGFTVVGSTAAAEPFRFQATDLGSYLLFGSGEDFLSASEGLAGQAAKTAATSQPGEIAGGATVGVTDQAAHALSQSEANEASGRGATIVAAAEPSPLADWEIDGEPGSFTISLPEMDRALVAGPDSLTLGAPEAASTFGFELAEGCATYPEIEVNVEGPLLGGTTGFQEVRGYLDGHLHMMAFEFLGGRARCGRPWHRYGVAYALVDCADHKPGGYGALLEQVVSKKEGEPHNTDGWPTFEGWPAHDSLTHEQVYYKWLERAWRGGLRMFTNLLVDNNQLCKIYPLKRNSCNEMDGVRLQAKRIHELERYIDAQNGGPGEGWFRIVTDPFEARRVINEGKLAVILGIEVSVPLDCGLTLDTPRCDATQVDRRLDEVYDLGVRQMELVNKFDNAFSGVAGDNGTTGVVVNHGNLLETGRYWQMDTCQEEDGHAAHAHDRTQYNFHDESGAPEEFSGRDALAGAIFATTGTSGATPIYPAGPHCNQMGLSELGRKMIAGMVQRGMIFDPDHMSAKAQTQALDYIENDLGGYSGLISSHGWSNETIYPRIYELGGFVTPYAGDSDTFVGHWREHRKWADPRYFFGFGYGADTNGFGSQGGPRDGANPVSYPFTGFGGVTIDRQVSGTKSYDFTTDGVAHYGLYPDWIEDLRRQAGDEIIADMERGPEAYLQMWERAIGIAPDSCRTDVSDLSERDLDGLKSGMTPEEVLRALGQPSTRLGTAFTYCVEGGRQATLGFTPQGALQSWTVEQAQRGKPAHPGPPAGVPGNGGPPATPPGHTHAGGTPPHGH